MIREAGTPAGQRPELVVVDEPAGIARPVDERRRRARRRCSSRSARMARMGTMPISSATNSGRRVSASAPHEAAEGPLELDLAARGEAAEPARARPVGRHVGAQGDGGRRRAAWRRSSRRARSWGRTAPRPTGRRRRRASAARSWRDRPRAPRSPARAPRSRERGTAPASRASVGTRGLRPLRGAPGAQQRQDVGGDPLDLIALVLGIADGVGDHVVAAGGLEARDLLGALLGRADDAVLAGQRLEVLRVPPGQGLRPTPPWPTPSRGPR